jgi:hypothetical protein
VYLFNRVAEVCIGQQRTPSVLSLKGLRITFEVKKTKTIMPNTAKIEIYNLSEASRNQIKDSQAYVLIRAGYEAANGLEDVYSGTILRVTHQRRPPDVITTIEAQDGIVSLNKRVSLGYPAGTSATRVLNDLIAQMGTSRKESSVSVQDKQLAGGFSTVGTAHDAMDRITRFLGLEWSIQDGAVKIVKIGGADSAGIVYLSPENGLLESPMKVANVMPSVDMYSYQGKMMPMVGASGSISFMAPGWKVKALLRPSVEPKSKISVDSIAMPKNSLFMVETVHHQGDTTDTGPWESSFDVYEVRS